MIWKSYSPFSIWHSPWHSAWHWGQGFSESFLCFWLFLHELISPPGIFLHIRILHKILRPMVPRSGRCINNFEFFYYVEQNDFLKNFLHDIQFETIWTEWMFSGTQSSLDITNLLRTAKKVRYIEGFVISKVWFRLFANVCLFANVHGVSKPIAPLFRGVEVRCLTIFTLRYPLLYHAFSCWIAMCAWLSEASGSLRFCSPSALFPPRITWMCFILSSTTAVKVESGKRRRALRSVCSHH